MRLAACVFVLFTLSGCLGGEAPDSLDADAPDPGDDAAPAVPVDRAQRPDATGPLSVRHFSGSSEAVETTFIGYHTSIGRGIHVADVQVPPNATALQFELRHAATLDADPYVLAPRNPCGGGGSDGPYLTSLTGYAQDEPGMYVDRDDGAYGVVRVDADVLERHGCARPCPDVREPEYDGTCRTWQLGFRVDPASGPFAWEAAFTAAVGVPLEEEYSALA